MIIESDISILSEVNIHQFATRTGNDVVFMKELVAIGEQSFEKLFSNIKVSLSVSDSEHFRSLVHTLKGSAELLGMLAIGAKLRFWFDNAEKGILPSSSEFEIVEKASKNCIASLTVFINNKK